MAAVQFVDYSFAYPNAESNVLENITLSIEKEDFVLLCGTTGSGKTTLLRNIKREIAPVGRITGTLTLFTQQDGGQTDKEHTLSVGFVSQSPENQIVMDSVWQELCFGLENMGLPNHVIKRRIAETVHFFGIDYWINKKTSELSGGQKQMLNLASVMAMQPKLLILDEPTAQLDPIAAKEFIQMIGRVNDELGTTIVLSEHHLEGVLPMANKVLFMQKGRVSTYQPQDFVKALFNENNTFTKAFPSAANIAYKLGEKNEYPLTVRQGKNWIDKHNISLSPPKSEPAGKQNKKDIVLQGKGLWYRYAKTDDFAVKEASINVYDGQVHALVGSNGSGKSTLLHLLCGAYKPNRGKVVNPKKAKIGLLTQNPKALFICDTVYEELLVLRKTFHYTKEDVNRIAEKLHITSLFQRHPYDLSGGEMQKTALAKLLLLSPNVLLLDEPTKGIDAAAKEELMAILKAEKAEGKSIVLVTHDLEFAAEAADTCSMMQNGEIICSDQGKRFFCSNFFYTTAANKITRDAAQGCVTIGDVMPRG